MTPLRSTTPSLHSDREAVPQHPDHFRQLGVDLFEDLLIAGIGTADDANQRIAFYNGHAFDALALHQLHDPVERSVRGHSDDVSAS